MNKNFWLLIISVTFALLGLASCEEAEEIDAYANWRVRNDAFIDSIANVATNSTSGWRIYKAWNLPPDEIGGTSTIRNVNDYIYVRVIEEGTGTITPLYTDSIEAHYNFQYFTGEVLQKTFRGEDPDPEIDRAAGFRVSGVVVGFQTAAQYMRQGDRWMVYIPWSLGYGESNYTPPGSLRRIVGGSTLVYDLTLANVITSKKETKSDSVEELEE